MNQTSRLTSQLVRTNLRTFVKSTQTRKAVDLRSDTVTRPSEKMKQAMYSCELGDDVWGTDPTVNQLQ